MSGHVSRDRIAIRIREVSRRPVRFFACVRNATDHLASHYNWLLSRGDQLDKGSHLNRIYSAMVGNGSTTEGVNKPLKEFPDMLNLTSGFLPAAGFDGSDNKFRAAQGRSFDLTDVAPAAALCAMLVWRTVTKSRQHATP